MAEGWGCSRPGVQGTSRGEAALGRTEPLSPTHPQPVEPYHCQGLRAEPQGLPQILLLLLVLCAARIGPCTAHHTALGLKTPFFCVAAGGNGVKFIYA